MKVKCNKATGKCIKVCDHAVEHERDDHCTSELCPTTGKWCVCIPVAPAGRYPRESTMADEETPVMEQYKKEGTGT
jgi:hypothetical protein